MAVALTHRSKGDPIPPFKFLDQNGSNFWEIVLLLARILILLFYLFFSEIKFITE